MRRLPFVMVAAAFLAACNTESRNVRDDEFDPSKVAYFRDARTGVCFAVTAYERMDTAARLAAGMAMGVTPCTEDVVKLLRNK